MKTESLISFGKRLAIVTAIIGTIILALYYASIDSTLAFAGLFFFLLAAFINIVVLAFLLIRAVKDRDGRKGLLRTSGLMLLNLPLALFYIFLGGCITNTMRITVKNTTRFTVTRAHFIGCNYDKVIDKLEPGESKTFTFQIPGDCDLQLSYLQNGKKVNEVVSSYITNSGGAWITYRLGQPNQEL